MKHKIIKNIYTDLLKPEKISSENIFYLRITCHNTLTFLNSILRLLIIL